MIQTPIHPVSARAIRPRASFQSRSGRALLAILVAASCAMLTGCSATGSPGTGDPITDVTYAPLSVERRVEAVDRAWQEVLEGRRNRAATRRVLKDIAWDVLATPEPVRAAIVDRLMTDPDEAGLADAESLAKLMLPTERSREVTAVIATRAVENGWQSVTPALVRSLARPARGDVDDLGRVEAEAIRRLHPGRSVVEVVFEVFLDPQTDPGPRGLRLDERTRAAAWDLLGRIDRDGAQRVTLLTDLDASSLSDAAGAMVEDMRASSRELRTIPRTAAELRWLRSIRDKLRAGDADARRWWDEASSTLARLTPDQRRGLALRHVEVVRVAAQRTPEWFDLSARDAVGAARTRLAGRERFLRRSDVAADNPRRTERVRDFEDRLVWADAVAIGVLDAAVRDDDVVERLSQFVELDRANRSTEYGGVLRATAEGFEVQLYTPRQRDQTSDTEFVASEDMIAQSDFSLAHFHLHVHQTDNSRYAGPSLGDLNYAALSGRNCVVISSVGRGRVNADYFQPDGATIDLGEIRW